MTQRKTVRKWVWVWEFEKEEQWLNTMAMQGWVLDSVGFCTYNFIKCEPGEYTVRLEMREHDEEYIEFMKETNAEYLGRMVKWIYFRKKAVYGEFDIFSDIDSRIKHLDKISKMLSFIGFANMLIGISNSFNPSVYHIGWINLVAASFLMYALGRIHEKADKLKKDRITTE